MKLRHLLPLFALTLIGASCSQPSIADELSAVPTEGLRIAESNLVADAQETELFEMVNTHRASLGLESLTFNATAYKYSIEHNNFMAANDVLNHENFSTRAASIVAETNATSVSENVARRYTTLERTLEGWLASPAHRATIEGDFTHAAISIVIDANGDSYYTQMFFK